MAGAEGHLCDTCAEFAVGSDPFPDAPAVEHESATDIESRIDAYRPLVRHDYSFDDGQSQPSSQTFARHSDLGKWVENPFLILSTDTAP